MLYSTAKLQSQILQLNSIVIFYSPILHSTPKFYIPQPPLPQLPRNPPSSNQKNKSQTLQPFLRDAPPPSPIKHRRNTSTTGDVTAPTDRCGRGRGGVGRGTCGRGVCVCAWRGACGRGVCVCVHGEVCATRRPMLGVMAAWPWRERRWTSSPRPE